MPITVTICLSERLDARLPDSTSWNSLSLNKQWLKTDSDWQLIVASLFLFHFQWAWTQKNELLMDARVGSSKEPNMAHKGDRATGSQPSATFSTSTSLLNINVTNTADTDTEAHFITVVSTMKSLRRTNCTHTDRVKSFICTIKINLEIWTFEPKVTRPFCLPPFCSPTSPSLGFKTL